MGSIINPISIRLGQNTNWKSNWVSKINRKYLIFDDFFYNQYINWFFNNNSLMDRFNLSFSHYIIKKSYNYINVILIINIFNFEKKYRNFITKYFNASLVDFWKMKKLFTININLTNIQWIKEEYQYFLYSLFLKNKKWKTMFNYRFETKRHLTYSFLLHKYYFLKIIYYNILYYIVYLIKNNFLWYLKKSNINLNKVIITIKYINMVNINSFIVLKYIIIKLKEQYNLNQIIKPLLKILKKNKNIMGIRIGCFGRFSRKQRATRVWYSFGKVPFNTLVTPIDYSTSNVFLKNSVCGIKVYLTYKLDYLNTINLNKLKMFSKNNFLVNLNYNFFIKYYIKDYLKFFKKNIWYYYQIMRFDLKW